MKAYVIYFDWLNTSGNHAGMAYLSRQLDAHITSVVAIKMISSRYKVLRGFNFIYSILLSFYFKVLLKKDDKVFLMEYMARGSFHDFFALVASKLNASYTTVGLVHLAGSHLLEVYKTEEKIKRKLSFVDEIMVFGSSLESFIRALGLKKNVIRTFHYVDDSYYQPRENYLASDSIGKALNIVCIGNIKRDFVKLRRLVSKCKNQNFHICQGLNDLSRHFVDCSNVILHKFLSENELLSLMQKSDISLSIMDDTIGSNVITTSLACGLVQVVSDVGSIRDYCTKNDSFFCESEKDFVTAIESLSNDSNLILKMKKNARSRSSDFSLNKFIRYFESTFLDGKK